MLKAPDVQPWHQQLGQIVYEPTVEFMIIISFLKAERKHKMNY